MVGNVGDVVTIKGDYLNLMHGVIFAGSDTIKEAEFVGHDRYTIQVKIPAEARTGVITLTDTIKDGTSLETKEELTINTPEATLEVCDRQVPGISEAIRAESMKYTKRAMLSRGVSAIRGRSLIVNLPGSPKAVEESLEVILDTVGHGILLMRGTDGECGR